MFRKRDGETCLILRLEKDHFMYGSGEKQQKYCLLSVLSLA